MWPKYPIREVIKLRGVHKWRDGLRDQGLCDYSTRSVQINVTSFMDDSWVVFHQIWIVNHKYLIIGLDVSQHDFVRVEAFPVDQLLHGLLAHSTHVVRQGKPLLGQ